MIKSARVMKKAVAYLIPFMEKEKAEQIAAATADGETFKESVSMITFVNLSACLGLQLSFMYCIHV